MYVDIVRCEVPLIKIFTGRCTFSHVKCIFAKKGEISSCSRITSLLIPVKCVSKLSPLVLFVSFYKSHMAYAISRVCSVFTGPTIF